MDSKVRPSAHSGLRGNRDSVPVCITGSCSRHNRYSEDSITAQAGRKECSIGPSLVLGARERRSGNQTGRSALAVSPTHRLKFSSA